MKKKILSLVIILIMSAGCIGVSDEELPIEPPECLPPKAIINASHNETYQMVGVMFNGSLSIDPDGNITSYYWYFGDGNFSEDNITTHHFSRIGKNIISLIVLDNSGIIDLAYYSIIINNALEMELDYYSQTSKRINFYINVTNNGGEEIGVRNRSQERWTLFTEEDEVIIGDGWAHAEMVPKYSTNYIEVNETKRYWISFDIDKEITPIKLIFQYDQYYYEINF